MAEMARAHHNDLQHDEDGVPQGPDRERCIRKSLQALEMSVSNEQRDSLGASITYDECESALRFSKNGTAPGRDGIPYELWKTLHARIVEDRRH